LEFALLGLLAGLLGALLAQIGIFFLETQIFDLEATFHANIWIMGPIIGTVLICALSIILILSITRKNPKEIIYSS
jgi:putative ABC transport system permease protein